MVNIEMLYHLSSHDPDNYNVIRFSSGIHKHLKNVRYRVNNLSFSANILSVTENDYYRIKFEDELIPRTIYFKDHVLFNKENYIYELVKTMCLRGEIGETPILPFNLRFGLNDRDLLTIQSDKEFSIVEASHRCKLVFGLYNITLPIHSKNKQLVCSSAPLFSYGNVLYLSSRTGQVCGFNNMNDKEETRSIAYKVNDAFCSGYPIICKLPGSWGYMHSSQLSDLTFELLDFQLYPIKMLSPLFITLEVSDMNELKADIIDIEQE